VLRGQNVSRDALPSSFSPGSRRAIFVPDVAGRTACGVGVAALGSGS
jgi:hypothetical protein